eukprot:10122796-Alexandrium_andersonii.AAC.1
MPVGLGRKPSRVALLEAALIQTAAAPRGLGEADGQRCPGARVPVVLEAREAAELAPLRNAGRRVPQETEALGLGKAEVAPPRLVQVGQGGEGCARGREPLARRLHEPQQGQ